MNNAIAPNNNLLVAQAQPHAQQIDFEWVLPTILLAGGIFFIFGLWTIVSTQQGLLRTQEPLIVNQNYLDNLKNLTREQVIEQFRIIQGRLLNRQFSGSIERIRIEWIENFEELLKRYDECNEFIEINSPLLSESIRELTQWVDWVSDGLTLLNGFV